MRRKFNPNSKDFTYLCGGEFDETVVKLSFYGDDLDPADLTTALAIKPTRAYRKGDLSENKKMLMRHGCWQLATPWVSTLTLEDNLRAFLRRLPAGKRLWKQLTARFDTELTLVMRMRTWNRSGTIAADLVRELADRNLRIGLDMYFDDSVRLWSEKDKSRTRGRTVRAAARP